MTKLTKEINLGNLLSYEYPTDTYDPDKLGLPVLMVQNTGEAADDRWAGPITPAIARPVETAGAVPGIMPWVYRWSDNEDWIFLADNAAAGVTRRIQLFKFNRQISQFAWKGFITLTFPFAGTQGTYLVRGLRMSYETYTTGTASTSGTSVTGTGSAWADSRIPVGCRVGFGSSDPTEITTWYEIESVNSNTGITLISDAGTITDGPYVIEDLRAFVIVTNAATPTNGGLFQVKGLSHDMFTGGGTVIPAATTVDSIRAVYWLADAATTTNTVSIGLGIDTLISFTEQDIYVLDTLVNPVVFKYNIRAALSLTAGKATNALVLKTGSGGAVIGVISQVNNLRLVTTSHGPGAGLDCLYFTTTTRVYRTSDVSTFSHGSTTWLSGGDVMNEVPPGGVATQALTNVLNSIEYTGFLDKFIITTSSAANSRHYITQYRTDAGQWDRAFLMDTRQTNQNSSSIDTAPVPSTMGLIPHIWVEGGIAYMTTTGVNALTNYLYAFPVGADWEYADTTGQRLILPKVSTAGALNYSKISVTFQDIVGGTSGYNLGVPTEGIRVYYRTAGIDDNSGAWVLVPDSGDISGADGADFIQCAVEFKTIGFTCQPSKVYNVLITYNDFATDGHYQPSVGESDLINKHFAWRMSSERGGTVPTMRVRLYNALTGFLLNEDDSVTQDGTWEKSVDGGSSWIAYNDSDKANDITYIRYTPSALIDNVRVRAVLTEN